MNVFDLDARIGLDTSEYNENLSKSEGSFLDFGAKIKTGIGNVAKITASAVSAVASGVSKMTDSMVNSSMELANYGDNIDKASQKLGISAKGYQEWEAVMQHSGTSMESMTATFKTLANASQNLTDDQVAAFEKLGMSIEEVGKMSAEDLFKETITRLQDMGESTERTALASTLLGRGAMEMGALLNTSSEDTQAMIDRVNELGGVMSDEAVKASALFNDNLQDMTTAIDGVKRGITAEFLPGLSQLMDGFTGLLTGSEDAEEKLVAGFDSITEGLKNNIVKLKDIATTIIPLIADTLVSMLPELADMGTDIIEMISDHIIDELPELVDSATAIIDKLLNGLIEALPELTQSGAYIIEALINTIVVSLPELITAALEIIKSLSEYLIDAIPEMIPTIVELVMDIADMLTEPDTLVALLDAALQLILALTEGLLNSLPQLIAKVPVIIENLKNALIKAGPSLGQAAVELIGMLAAGLIEAVPAIIKALMQINDAIAETILSWGTGLFNAIKESWKQAWEALTPYLNLAKTWGKDLIDNFIGGIKAKWEDLKQSVSNVAQTVKDFLGFSEPKKGPLSNFHTYAPDMMDLYSKGIKENAGKLEASLQTSLEGVSEFFTPEKPQASATAATNIFNINISSDAIASDYDAYRAAQKISEELGNLQRMQALAVGA